MQGVPPTVVVAIDGPSGSGKSTVARGVAARLGLRYLDTGAMYRALTWLALREGEDLDDAAGLGDLAQRASIEVSTDPRHVVVRADGVDVTQPIRDAQVTAAVSRVAAVPAVRAQMVRRQRESIGAGGIVVEGRDIGTVVVPEAAVKVFLTADPDARAARRAAETDGAVAAARASLARRDALDSGRSTSPLTRADDAIEIDSTDLTADEVIDLVVGHVTAERSS